MNAELMELRARVAALERALVVASNPHRDGGRRSTSVAACALASIAAMATLLFLAAPISLRAAGPTTVTAPFAVVDGQGHVLLKVEAQPGRGAVLSLFNEAGRAVLQTGGSPSGCCGWVGVFGEDGAKPKAQLAVQYDDSGVVRLASGDDEFSQVSGKGFAIRHGSQNLAVMSAWSDGGYLRMRSGKDTTSTELMATNDGGIVEINNGTGAAAVRIEGSNGPGKMTISGGGKTKATIGVSADDAGLIVLNSVKGSSTTLHGHGVIRTTNPAGKDVIDLGIDPRGAGILDVRNPSAEGGVRLEVAEDGAGRVDVHSPPFEIKAQMGVKEGGKGDVCVTGGHGVICLSGIAIKSLIPW